MKFRVLALVIFCSACGSAPQNGRGVASAPAREVPASAPASNAPATAAQAKIESSGDGLGDLGAMTFRCPRAGLNAAAREAAKAPAQGRYQFAYFRIHSDSHHSTYEVHFKSNYQGEADLKYCVHVYCQQGQDPDTAASVSLIGGAPQPAGAGAAGAAHKADCGDQQKRVKQRMKR